MQSGGREQVLMRNHAVELEAGQRGDAENAEKTQRRFHPESFTEPGCLKTWYLTWYFPGESPHSQRLRVEFVLSHGMVP